VGREMKENGDRVNSSMIYLIHCKNFYKCHKVPPPSTTIKKKKKEKRIHIYMEMSINK
jgi:hypothetical protein